MTVNVDSRSDDWRAQQLSNFAQSQFEIDDEWFNSTEGFIQAIKFPEGHKNRVYGTILFGVDAKKLGETAERKYVWWQGRQIVYGSDEHHRLIARAIIAKFEQNSEKMKALMLTGDEEITHDLGCPEDPETSLPAKLFCKILMEIRKANQPE
jgi:predicted NAD-dependent protein-ADP-ribosyltransferase YbiA (DUF1768 family)